MKLIQYISTTYVREELYNPDNWDLINSKKSPEFISSGGTFCHKVELEGVSRTFYKISQDIKYHVISYLSLSFINLNIS